MTLLRGLLSEDGTVWTSLDDNEFHYFKVMMDEVFGRSCFVATVVWRSTDNSNNDAQQFSVDHNYLLVYSKTPGWLTIKSEAESKRSHFKNPDNDPRGPWFDGNPLNSPKPRPNLMFDIKSPTGHIIKPPKNGWRWSSQTLQEKLSTGEIRFTTDGKGIRRRTYLVDMKGLPPSTLWAQLEETGHNRQAKYELKNLFPERNTADLFQTPKPERLIQKILDVSTNPGDLVLDSFGGSGTTGAVAHKMGRKWILVELGEHCHTHILPRLKKVIDGTDAGGVTESVEWKGGGGFRYFRLAPSLLQKDRWGNWVIRSEYNAAMLAEAMCKHEGFRYQPSGDIYWQQGLSTERDFIYVTTQTLTKDQLAHLSAEVGPDRTLLVCCGAFRAQGADFPNLTIKKIPNAVLTRCEWGRDDYSLAVAELAPDDEPAEPTPGKAGKPAKAKGRAKSAQTLPLFKE